MLSCHPTAFSDGTITTREGQEAVSVARVAGVIKVAQHSSQFSNTLAWKGSFGDRTPPRGIYVTAQAIIVVRRQRLGKAAWIVTHDQITDVRSIV